MGTSNGYVSGLVKIHDGGAPASRLTGIFRPLLHFGYDRERNPYPPLIHGSPMLSDDFFKSDMFEREAGRRSIHNFQDNQCITEPANG